MLNWNPEKATRGMSAGAKRALDMVKDPVVKRQVLLVRGELADIADTSTRKYLDIFDAILTSLKETSGTPDDELCEQLAEGLDQMAHEAQMYDATLRRMMENKK